MWPSTGRKHTSKPRQKPGRSGNFIYHPPDVTASLDFRKGGRKGWMQAFRPGSSSQQLSGRQAVETLGRGPLPRRGLRAHQMPRPPCVMGDQREESHPLPLVPS